jgi:hypothetical protein
MSRVCKKKLKDCKYFNLLAIIVPVLNVPAVKTACDIAATLAMPR